MSIGNRFFSELRIVNSSCLSVDGYVREISAYCEVAFRVADAAQCSRTNGNPNFIAQEFFHFSSFIHNGDNLNIWENLNFHREFLKKSKFCTY